jgi:hypothetical protein
MAPPKTLAPAAVNPSSTLVKMGDMREKNIRNEPSAISRQPSGKAHSASYNPL